MSDFGWQFDQHYERYREARTMLSRTALLAVVFAVVVLLKVVRPYAELSKDRATAVENQINYTADKAEADRRSVDLKALNERFAAVIDAIRARKWHSEIDNLKSRFTELNRSYSVLKSLPPTRIRDAFDKRDLMRSEEVLQVAPGTTGQLQRPPMRRPQDPTLDREALEGRSRPTTLLRGEADPPQTAEITDPEAELAIAGAAEALRLNPDRIKLMITEGSRPDWQREVYKEAAAEDASRAVTNIYNSIARHVLDAIRELLEMPAAKSALPELPKQLRQLADTVKQWRDDRLADSGWYQTALGKESELDRLTEELVQATLPIDSLLSTQLVAAGTQLVELEATLNDVNSQIEELEARVEAIDAELEGRLPEWLRGIISARDMTQLYPIVLLGLLAFMGVNAIAANQHHQRMMAILARSDQPKDHSATSSIWLMSHSSLAERLTTGALYLGGLALFWLLFEQGCNHLVMWSQIEPESAWLPAGVIVLVTWFGRAVIIGAAAWTAVSLVRDRQ